MGKCYYCDVNVRENWSDSWCKSCKELKNIGAVYGFEKMLDVVKRCCLRNDTQLENNIKRENKEVIKK